MNFSSSPPQQRQNILPNSKFPSPEEKQNITLKGGFENYPQLKINLAETKKKKKRGEKEMETKRKSNGSFGQYNTAVRGI